MKFLDCGVFNQSLDKLELELYDTGDNVTIRDQLHQRLQASISEELSFGFVSESLYLYVHCQD